jgi:hypothetical protein
MNNDLDLAKLDFLELLKIKINLDETSAFAEGMMKEGAELVSMRVSSRPYRLDGVNTHCFKCFSFSTCILLCGRDDGKLRRHLLDQAAVVCI